MKTRLSLSMSTRFGAMPTMKRSVPVNTPNAKPNGFNPVGSEVGPFSSCSTLARMDTVNGLHGSTRGALVGVGHAVGVAVNVGEGLGVTVGVLVEVGVEVGD